MLFDVIVSNREAYQEYLVPFLILILRCLLIMVAWGLGT